MARREKIGNLELLKEFRVQAVFRSERLVQVSSLNKSKEAAESWLGGKHEQGV